jgi:hypothetical protein
MQKLTSLPIRTLLYVTNTLMSEKCIHNLAVILYMVYTMFPSKQFFLTDQQK